MDPAFFYFLILNKERVLTLTLEVDLEFATESSPLTIFFYVTSIVIFTQIEDRDCRNNEHALGGLSNNGVGLTECWIVVSLTLIATGPR
jgi:hypothetical protein